MSLLFTSKESKKFLFDTNNINMNKNNKFDNRFKIENKELSKQKFENYLKVRVYIRLSEINQDNINA